MTDRAALDAELTRLHNDVAHAKRLSELHEEAADMELGVEVLSKELDEEVARLHLDALGVKLTQMTQDQADYLGVPVNGPYQPSHYRY